MNRQLDWKSAGFFVCIVMAPAFIVGLSNWHIFPELRWQMTVLLAITVGVAFLTHRMASEPVDWLRQMGIGVCVMLGIILCCNTIAHIAYARELNAGRDSLTERHAEEDRALEREKERVALQSQLAAADSQRLDAARKVLVQTPAKDRGSLLSRLGLAGAVTAPAASKAGQPAARIEQRFATPEEIRAAWSGTILFLLILDCVASIIGGSVIWGARHWDRDGNGVPDFLKEIAGQSDELTFARQRPSDYARYGRKLSFPPGKP